MAAFGSENQHRMSFSRAVGCKLPFLDGKPGPTARPITVEVNPESAGELLENITSDTSHLKGTICAAWGLLLRCYTGQNDVCFYFRQHNGSLPDQSPILQQHARQNLRLSFPENGELRNQILEAEDDVVALEQQRQSDLVTVQNADLGSNVNNPNTMVWVREGTDPPPWQVLQAQRYIKVNDPIL